MKLLHRFFGSEKNGVKQSSTWQTVAVGILWSLARPWLDEWGVSEEQFYGVLGALGLGVAAQAAKDFGKEAKPEA